MSDAAHSPDNVFDLYVLLKDESAALDSSFKFSNLNLLNNIITGNLYIDNQLVEFEIDSYSIMYFDHFSVGDYLFNIIDNKYIKRIDYSSEC